MISSVEIIQACGDQKLSEFFLSYEIKKQGLTRGEILNRFYKSIDVMFDSVEKGVVNNEKSMGGLIGGFSSKIMDRKKKSPFGEEIVSIIARAIGVSEINASMGKIVASPTAGACGVLPSVLYTYKQSRNVKETDLVMSLINASGIGLIAAHRAYISGACGGCQAETGVASAMVASAITELEGGNATDCFNAASISLTNVLGLVCDPIAGLVEDPCARRNALCALNGILGFELTQAGFPCYISFDEAVDSMKEVGDMLPYQLKETALGGVASTESARKISEKIIGCKL